MSTAQIPSGPYDPDTGRWGYCTQAITVVDGVVCGVHEDSPLHGGQ